MRKIKFCPLCGGEYKDEAYLFCLSDGTPLNDSLDEVETILRSPRGMDVLDAEIRRRSSLTDRAKSEETGLRTDQPTRMKRESDTYWNTRDLTFRLTGMHYRTPQFNLELLNDYINSRAFGQKHVIEVRFVASGDRNLNFLTKSGKITFDAHSSIDPSRFCEKFGLDPETFGS